MKNKNNAYAFHKYLLNKYGEGVISQKKIGRVVTFFKRFPIPAVLIDKKTGEKKLDYAMRIRPYLIDIKSMDKRGSRNLAMKSFVEGEDIDIIIDVFDTMGKEHAQYEFPITSFMLTWNIMARPLVFEVFGYYAVIRVSENYLFHITFYDKDGPI